ncbi:MAG TPA: alkaline phosphatase family protein [Candidatus Acidoferrales bacterium]|nr:alkaline phosphatase family protein [Candidatus Acidoferrales bacterium]
MKKLVLLLIAIFVPALLTAQIPNSSHVVVVLEENESYSAVIGSASMPYLNSLASENALATQYYANVHPSIGNYFMLTAGQLITNNDSLNTTVNVDNIVRHLLTNGKTWKSYAEGLPSVGYIGGDQYPYVRHHNPLSYFSDVTNSSVQRLNLVPFTHFATDLSNNQLPNYSFVVPNLNHDAHDCPTSPTGCTNAVKLETADAWLKNNIGPLFNSPEFQQDGILIIVFDEGFNTDTAHGGGHVVALAAGPGVRKGFKSTTFYQHQNVLRTTLDALGVHSYPGVAGSSADMTDLFGTAPPPPPGSCTATVAGVTVCSPAAGSTVASPVHFVAAAKSTHPITAMRIYVDNISKFAIDASSLDTSLAVATGTHSVVVQAWDSTGAVFKTPLTIHVQ